MKQNETVQPLLTRAQWQDLKTELIFGYEGPVPSYGRRKSHRWIPYAIWFINAGSATVVSENKSSTAGAGMIIQPVPISLRDQEFSTDAEILSLNFWAHWPVNMPLFNQDSTFVCAQKKYPKLVAASTTLVRLMNLHAGTDSNAIPFAAYVTYERQFLDWLRHWTEMMLSEGHTFRAHRYIDTRIRKAAALLDEHRFLSAIPYDRLAQETSLGRTQLDRLFKAEMNVSPKKYVDQNCFSLAMQLLRQSQMSIKQIAYELHFPNSAYFCRWFRKHIGQYPEAFRKSRM